MNWFQKIIYKAIGSPVPGDLGWFSNVVTNLIGIQAIWNRGGYKDNISAYESNATIYSIVDKVTKLAAIVPFKVYKVREGKKALHIIYKAWTGPGATEESLKKALEIKSLVYEEDDSHPLNELIENPNPWQKGNEFIVNSIGFKLLTGNRFLYVPTYDMGADKGKPIEFYNLPPQYMSIVPDGTPYGVKEYKFLLDRDDRKIPPTNIIHSKYFNPNFQPDGSHLMGLSKIKAGSRDLTRSDAALERSTAMLQNAGAAGMVVDETGGDESLETINKMKDDINSSVNGKRNAGRIGLLSGKFSYLNFGLNANDMQIVVTEKYSNQKICNLFGFPPGSFDPDKATYNNSKEFDKQIITGAVLPELNAVRDDLNVIAKMYKSDVIYVDYDLSVFPQLQEDQDKVATRMKDMWWFTGNEKRLATGGDQDTENPMMNEYLVPNGLVPLSQLGEDFNALMAGIENDN